MRTNTPGNPILRLPAGLALLTTFVLAVGCDTAEAPDYEVDAPPPALPGTEITEATVALAPVRESGVSGEATALHSEDEVVIVLEVQGLPRAGQYAAHIHAGTCADGGPVAVPLNAVVAGEDGDGTSSTTLDPDDMDHDRAHFFQVHSADGPPVACGDMEVHADLEPR
jgi:Cu/Zn superoxide dismutase